MGTFKLGEDPIDPAALGQKLASRRAGAVCAFEGRVRERNDGQSVMSLFYEAQGALCQKEAARILEEAKEKFLIIDAVCAHRVGTLAVGETAVWVGVLAEHRHEAFQAARYLIDEIKHRLPIWKKEHYADGSTRWVNCQQEHKTNTQFHEDVYYARQLQLEAIGPQGQAALKQARVLVVGAGGLGCPALMSLVTTGVGHVGICEDDVVEESNLHRQHLYTLADVGQPKAAVASFRLRAMNPSVQLTQHPVRLDERNVEDLIRGYDIILDATDRLTTKFLLNDACFLNKRILIQASVYQQEGQLHVMKPGSSGCLRCLWTKMPEESCVNNCAQAGVLGIVPNILGHYQALEAVKIILNWGDALDEEILIWDASSNRVQQIKRARNAACPLCSDHPTITAIAVPEAVMEISMGELHFSHFEKYSFIDVREEMELMMDPSGLDALHLPCSGLPMDTLPLEKDKPYLVFCAKGMRSLNVVRWLHEQGWTNTRSVAGGLPSITRYLEQHEAKSSNHD